MDNIAKYERKYKSSAYYRLPSDIAKNYNSQRMFQGLLAISAGYRTGPNTIYGYNVRKQASEEYLIKFCVKGKGWLKIGKNEDTIHAGELLIIKKHTKHAYGTNKSNPWSVYWVYFYCEYLEELLPELKEKKYIKLAITDDLAITNHFKTVMTNMAKGYAKPHIYAATSRLSLLLSNIQALMNKRASKEKHSFDGIIDYMNDNIDKSLDIGTIATMTGLSKDHFIRQFDKKYGFTPMDYFIRLKIQHACELLISTNESIKNIALSLGYADYYYFSRIFKQKMAQSPKAYRTNHQL